MGAKVVAGYQLADLFWYFILFSFIGWILEVTFHLFKEKTWVNRGFLYGPLCPVYGLGMVLVLMLTRLLGMQDMPFSLGAFSLHFLLIAWLASLLELLVGLTLRFFFHQRWWDYSGEKYQIGGYISLRFSFYWGLGGSFFYYLARDLSPASLLNSSPLLTVILARLIIFLFIFDFIKSADLLVRLRLAVGELARARADLERRIANIKEEDLDWARIELLIRKDRLHQVYDELAAKMKRLNADNREMVQRAIHRYDRLINAQSLGRFRRFFKAFPGSYDLKESGVFESIREALRKKS